MDLKTIQVVALKVADVKHQFATGCGFAAKPCGGELCIKCHDMELGATAAADVTLAGGNVKGHGTHATC